MRVLKLFAASLLVAAGFGTAVWLVGGAAASGGSPTIAADTTFNGGNPVLLDFPAPSGSSGSSFIEATAVARQSDGKVVVGGYNSVGSLSDFDVARLNPNGTLDTSFGTNGYAHVTPVPSVHNYIFGLAIQPDGKIVIAGTANFQEVALARLNADGSTDMSFGTNGVVLDNHAQSAYGLALDGNGNIDIATSSGSVFRYSSSGAPDTSFNTSGRSPSLMDSAGGIAIQADGKIVIDGSTGSSPSSAVVGRINSDGTTDTGFGTAGATNITPGGSGNESLKSVAFEGSDILVGGLTGSGAGGLIARLTPAGALDSSFGTGGRITDATGAGVSAVFYSPHPTITKVVNDSDESQGDSPDDQDSGTCIADPSTGALISCVPADTESGSVQAGTQTVGTNGSTVDLVGDTPGGTYATVSQVVTSDGSGGTTSSSSSTTTTTSNDCPGGVPHPCADLATYSHKIWFRSALGASIPIFGQGGDGVFAATGDTVSWDIEAYNAGPDPANCSLAITAIDGKKDTLSCGQDVAPGSTIRLDWPFTLGVKGRAQSAQGSLSAKIAPTDATETSAGDSEENTGAGISWVQFGSYWGKHPDLEKLGGEGIYGVMLGTGGNRFTSGLGKETAPAPIKLVEVAIIRVHAGACRWVAGKSGSLAASHSLTSCAAPVWLHVTDTKHWSIRFTHKLPPGKYVVLAQAIDAHGNPTTPFSRKLHTEAVFTVH